ncbi:MAG: DUF1501 domain-containing protein [Planctomycetes bacterium]|nr:DUF1501 domain-containing protein [Planctomycetota bacterium]
MKSEFGPSPTAVPGIEISDQLPQLARQAGRLTIIRSMTHRDFEHGTAAYTALTGQPHPNPGTNTPASPDDFPTYGSVVTKLAPTGDPVPDAVVLGPVLHQGNRPPVAGQNAGFLGPGCDPFRIADDLVVCLGEFGRTPKINENAGRDHWPDCYSVVVAGGGIADGRTFGASNRTAAYPTSDEVFPWDLAATMYHLLGVDPHEDIVNRQGQPLPIARGRVVSRLF